MPDRQALSHEPVYILGFQVLQVDGRRRNSRDGDVAQGRHEGMGLIDIAVPAGPDHQQVVDSIPREQHPQKFQGGQIGPLPVVDEDDEGMLAGADRFHKV